MPIYWSPSSKTALAESELEYEENHRSISIYVKFPLIPPKDSSHEFHRSSPLHALVWTTTPWTLPANRAICFNPDLKYVKIRFQTDPNVFVVAQDCVGRLEEVFGQTIDILGGFEREDIGRYSYAHPLSSQLTPSSPASRPLPFLPSKHVTTAKGSGLVHAAPAHGHEDYHALRACGLRVDEDPLVDREGKFTQDAGEALRGLDVLDSG